MRFASVRELSQNPSKFVDNQDPVIITKRGKPVRALISMNEDDLEDFIIAERLGLEKDLEQALLSSTRGQNIPAARLRNKFLKKLSS